MTWMGLTNKSHLWTPRSLPLDLEHPISERNRCGLGFADHRIHQHAVSSCNNRFTPWQKWKCYRTKTGVHLPSHNKANLLTLVVVKENVAFIAGRQVRSLCLLRTSCPGLLAWRPAMNVTLSFTTTGVSRFALLREGKRTPVWFGNNSMEDIGGVLFWEDPIESYLVTKPVYVE